MKIKFVIWGLLTALSSGTASAMTVGSQLFVVSETPITAGQTERFQNLSPYLQEQFEEKHFQILEKAAKILSYNKLTLGTGFLIAGKISEVYHRNDIPNPILNLIQQSNTVAAPLSIRQRGHHEAQFILSSMDQFLWEHLEIISEAKEFGVAGVVGVEAGFKAGELGACPACGLGVSFAYNAETESLNFDLFTDLEFVEKAYPFIAQASLFGRLMIFASSKTSGGFKDPLQLRVISPTGFIATMDAPTHLSVGVELGVGFPPFDSIASYKARLTRRILLKKATDFSMWAPVCSNVLRWLKLRQAGRAL